MSKPTLPTNIRRLTAKERCNGMKWCAACLRCGIRTVTVYRERGGELCCPEHFPAIDNHMSEADYATWGRL